MLVSMSDYKYEIQMIAEEMAEHEEGVAFGFLTSDEQYHLYLKATGVWADKKAAAAEESYDRIHGF